MFGLKTNNQRFPFLRDIGDLPKTRRNIHSIVLHHTAGNPMDTAEQIDHIHRTRKDPFYMIGYHFVVLRNGMIQIGRPLGRTPASVRGKNKGTVAMVMTGNYNIEPIPHRLDPQARAAGLLAAALLSEYSLFTVKFHRDLGQSDCPGLNLTHKIVDGYVNHISERYYQWAEWYFNHANSFNQLYPGYKFVERNK